MLSIFKLSKKLSVILFLAACGGNQETFAGSGITALGLAGATLAVTPFAGALTGIIIASKKVHKARMMRKAYSNKDAEGRKLYDGETRLVTDPEELREIREGQLVKWGLILGLSCAAFFPTLTLATFGGGLGLLTAIFGGRVE